MLVLKHYTLKEYKNIDKRSRSYNMNLRKFIWNFLEIPFFLKKKSKQQLYLNNGQLEEILLSKFLTNNLPRPDMEVHAYLPSTWEAKEC